MPELFIRRATSSDAELLTQLGAQTFKETFAADNTAENMLAYLAVAFNFEQQTRELEDPGSSVFIAEMDGTPLGYAMLKLGPRPSAIEHKRSVELVRLYVTNASIGTGVGAALMKRCMDESVSRNYESMWLGVWENNLRAQDFYRRWHFREVGTHVFQLGDDPQRDLLMERSFLAE